MSINYKDSGVNIDAGNESVERIKNVVKETFTKNVVTGLGTFGAMYDVGFLKDYKEPVIVQSIDSVGTKIIVAAMAKQFEGIGEDMVGHSCGDILCQGAKPLTFLDYLAFSHLDPQQVEDIVKGMSKACKKVGMSLIGGETAELPGVYAPGEFDVVGSVLGVVEKDKIITGEKIKEGDIALGLASVGLHTNGFSLARKIFFESGKYNVDSHFEELNFSLAKELLIPHHNYAPSVLPILDKYEIKGIAHITGGGLVENVPRVLPKSLSLEITKGSWEVLPIFKLIKRLGNVADEEMYRVFNMGIGMVLIVGADFKSIKADLEKSGERVYQIGKVVRGNKDVRFV